MRHAAGWRCPAALHGKVLSGGNALYSLRHRGCFPLPVGDCVALPEVRGAGHLLVFGDARVHPDRPCWILVRLEEGRARLEQARKGGEDLGWHWNRQSPTWSN